MILTKRNSRTDLATLNNLIDGLFTNNFSKTETSCNSSKPGVNIIENENDFQLHIALPGIAKENIDINIDGDLLTISKTTVESKETTTEKEKEVAAPKFLRKEFSLSDFKRTFTLPDSVNANDINASNENGVLTITLPKKEEAKAVKKTINIA